MKNNPYVQERTKKMIAVIESSNPGLDNYKFKREQVLLRETIEAGKYSISALDCDGVNCLKKAGYTRLSEIICMSNADIKSIRGIGTRKAECIITALNKVREPICSKILAGDNIVPEIKKAIQPVVPSVYDIIEKIPDGRQKEILEARFAGMKLEDIAKVLDLTRERVRQIQEQGIKKAHSIIETEFGSKVFLEDKYKEFFKKYKTDIDFWRHVSMDGEKIYGYLDTVYGYGRGKKCLTEAHSDESLDIELKDALNTYSKGRRITVNGVDIALTCKGIEDYLIKKYCQTPMTTQDFIAKYNDFLIINGLDTQFKLVTMEQERNIAGRLEKKRNILWLGSNSFRTYDFSNTNFEKFLDELNLHRYKDTEFSVALLFKNYPSLMKEYDIQDEYELHYILKKIVNKKTYPDIHFGRTPMISFGASDRDCIVFSTMVKMAPVNKSDLIKVLSEETGVKENVISANWLKGISKYYSDGKYVFDCRKYGFLYRQSA